MNTNAANVMVGVRVLVGTQSTERAPSYLEVFGRTTQVSGLNDMKTPTVMVGWGSGARGGGHSKHREGSILSGSVRTHDTG